MTTSLKAGLGDIRQINLAMGRNTPGRLYQRFVDGKCSDPKALRITSRESEAHFPERDDGLAVLLINPPIREWSYPNIMPLGQGYVASVAAMDGHQVHVLDLNAERKIPRKDDPKTFKKWIDDKIEACLGTLRPDVIGIGGIITQYGRIKDIVALCKRIHPDVPVILGGGLSSCMPEFMLQRMQIDAAVLEEGEITFSELLHRIELGESLRGVKGVAFRDYAPDGSFQVVNNGLRPSLASREAGLDAIPWPLHSRWPINEVYKRNPVGHLNWQSKWKEGAPAAEGAFSLSLIASRGCPYAVRACDYCYAAYLGQAYRLRSPKEVVDEMEYLKKEYGASYLHFLDDLLMTDMRWARELVDELSRRRRDTGFEVMWGGTCRTNIIANDVIKSRADGRANILELAYDVGMRQAAYGVETGSETVLKAIDKSGQTPDKIKVAITETQRVFGYADASFMIGSPGETPETVKETVDLCKEIGLKPEVFFFTTAYPATSFWQLALDKGLITKAVTGIRGPADDDMIERYFLLLGEQGESVRTNFSDMEDEQVVELSWSAVQQLGAQNVYRHPHTGDIETRNSAVRGATMADI